MRCFGILLHGWDVKTFETIGYNLGVVIAVDTKMMYKDCLEYGLMMIEVSGPFTIADTVSIVIFGKISL